MCFLFWWSLIFFICPSGFLVQTSWGNLKLCGVAVIDMCRHILWIAGFHWLRFFFWGGGAHVFIACLACVWWRFSHHNLCCATQCLWHVGWSCTSWFLYHGVLRMAGAAGLKTQVYDCAAILMINLHISSATCWHTEGMLQLYENLSLCKELCKKKKPTWQSLGFWFWPLLLLISTYHAILSFRRPLQRLLAP